MPDRTRSNADADGPDSASQPGPTNAPRQERTQPGPSDLRAGTPIEPTTSGDEEGGQSYDYGRKIDEEERVAELYRTPEEGEGGTSFDYGQLVTQPNTSDLKEEWVTYAETQGMDRAEAEDATKDELIQKFGG